MISRRCCQCSPRTTSQCCDNSCPISIGDKIWDSNGRKNPNYCHHNHQFDQSKTCLVVDMMIRIPKHSFPIRISRLDFSGMLESEILAEATVSPLLPLLGG
jgi:hypothetical protein